MKIDQEMRFLEVYYDGSCALCCRYKGWFEQQRAEVEVQFIDYASDAARKRFPELLEYEPARAMVVRSDSGMVYQGEEATLMTLWHVRAIVSCKDS
ncbi:DCC1-like thiol-disulfide oxidoreductase family protein [Rubritalea tangerina]|uniref:DCC1-like thiol-disulfide oxidoreductase family protein n=1 Tax=Rubritalea tangerina TaxID=430798 RepID=UPI003617B9F0